MSAEQFKIICNGFPPEFMLDKNLAKEYFKQFGKLKRMTFKQKMRICTVEYANKEGYLRALNNAGEFKGFTFTVIGDVSVPAKKVAKQSPLWVDKDEIEAELAAMSGYTPIVPKSHSLEGSTSPFRDLSKFEKPPKLKRVWKSENIVKQKAVKPKEKKNTLLPGEVDLVNLLLSQALTPDDKYKVLEARDKLLKLKLKKTPLLKSAATVGSCPDMCPEKERIFREIKHQVAWYEQDEEKCMNHNKAVKQYSRSSADQEAPLAHELRPVAVLQMTMGYLLHNIVDLCDTDEVHLGEWFHFLWDRTRGIRKDITQQALCSRGAVDLVEQCARFHIHCSARLVGEDPSVFDQKINTENLTKCLQTLKYMYDDLRLKSETCENEAEFRAYIILLNLNDGNFMWEVQQLPLEVQRSKEVRFALQVHSAIDKNNYVQFFKLVYSTTYLNACILMRYFVQVRITALKTLLKCYIPRAAKTSYPLLELQSILAFDDNDATRDMLVEYGLSINDEGTHVILDKNSFVPPDFSYVLDRSMIVEDKRIFSVGRIICGKDLPPKVYETHKIQQSFDNRGFLVSKDILDDLDLEKVKLKLLEELGKSEEIEMKEEEEEEKKQTSFTFIQREKPDPFSFIEKSQKTGSPNPFALANKPITKSGNIFGTVEATPLATKNIFSSEFTFQSPTPVSVPQSSISSRDEPDFVTRNENIFTAFSNPKPVVPLPPKVGGFSFNLIETPQSNQPIGIKQLPSTTQLPLPVAPQPLPIAPQPLPVHHSTEDIVPIKPPPLPTLPTIAQTEDLEEKKKKEESLRILEEQRLEAQRKLELEKRQEEKRLAEAKIAAERRRKELLKKQQEEELRRKLEALQKEEETKRENEIKDAVKEVMNNLISVVDNNIRTEKLTKLKENMSKRILLKTFKKWKLYVAKKKRKRKAFDFVPMWAQSRTLEQSAEELHTSYQDLTLTLMKRYKYGEALDVGQLLDEKIDNTNLYQLTYSILKKRIFEQSVNKPKNIFWKVLVSLPDKTELDSGLNRLEETMASLFPWKQCEDRMLFLKQVKPNLSESITYCVERQQGYNVKEYDANGIIFIGKTFNSSLQRRIFENLKGFGVYVKIPVVIILEDYSPDECKLEELIKQNIVSDYVILVENPSALKMVNVIEEGLVFLAKKVEKSPPLELDSLKAFMKTYLCSEIWKRANSFAKWNSNYKKCLQSPNIVISLYNEGLNKLKSIILKESNREYAVFPEEFKKYLKSEAPDFLPCSFRYFPKFWKSKNYVNKLEAILKKLSLPIWQDVWPPPNEYELELSVFKYCSRITKEPKKLFYRIMSVLLRNIDPNFNFQDIQNILWTDVVELLGLERLSDNIALDEDLKSKSVFKEYFVVYNVDLLNDYRYCDWFYIYNPRIKKCVEDEFKKSPVKELTKPLEKQATENLDFTEDFIESVRNNYLLNKSDKSEMLRDLVELNQSLKSLTENMAVHKRISLKLDESLSKAIAEK